MSQFEFFMTFYGLFLGLAVAELLGGFASILREREPPRLGLILPLLGVIALIEIMATFVDAWTTLRGVRIAMSELVTPTIVALAYFSLAAIMVPRHPQDWPHLDSYFDRRRPWIIGLLLGVNLVLIARELAGVVLTFIQQENWASVGSYALRNGWLVGSYVVLLLSRRRWLDVAAAVSVIGFYIFNYVVLPLTAPT